MKGLNSRAWKEVHADELDNLPAKRYAVLSDRGRAIKKAINMALIQDTVLVAGKGHETFQTIGNVQYAFDDRKVARQMLEQKTRSKANEIRKVGTS
jgi:UDP-N-acetylmuramoyl-L-alanyl-D-glutamate--2,6-diaminopimelate ligase